MPMFIRCVSGAIRVPRHMLIEALCAARVTGKKTTPERFNEREGFGAKSKGASAHPAWGPLLFPYTRYPYLINWCAHINTTSIVHT